MSPPTRDGAPCYEAVDPSICLKPQDPILGPCCCSPPRPTSKARVKPVANGRAPSMVVACGPSSSSAGCPRQAAHRPQPVQLQSRHPAGLSKQQPPQMSTGSRSPNGSLQAWQILRRRPSRKGWSMYGTSPSGEGLRAESSDEDDVLLGDGLIREEMRDVERLWPLG